MPAQIRLPMYARSRNRYMFVLKSTREILKSTRELSLFQKYHVECRAAVVKRGHSHVFLGETRQDDKNLTRSKRSYPDRIRVIDGSNLPRVRDRKSTLQ